jgi:hypothetical protein
MKSVDAQWYSPPEAAPPAADDHYPPPLVPIGEAPGYLGHISRSKLYVLVASGELKKVRIGSRAFISGESITAFLNKVLSSSGGVA